MMAFLIYFILFILTILYLCYKHSNYSPESQFTWTWSASQHSPCTFQNGIFFQADFQLFEQFFSHNTWSLHGSTHCFWFGHQHFKKLRSLTYSITIVKDQNFWRIFVILLCVYKRNQCDILLHFKHCGITVFVWWQIVRILL